VFFFAVFSFEMSKIDAAYKDKWEDISKRSFAAQAKWVLNGFWDTLGSNAEDIWKFVQIFIDLDKQACENANGYALDEFWSHKFLETLGETLTVIQLREKMRAIDLDFDKKMSVIEYLIFKYHLTVKGVCEAPQGGNPEELHQAELKVEAAQKAVAEMLERLERAKESKREAEKAEAENKAALEELHKQEDAYNNKKEELKKKSETGGLVSRQRAANELSQLLAEDPLPLRRAKINQEAAVKKAERATKKALEDENHAQAAVNEAEKSLQDALDFLQQAKQKGGNAMGDIWWMEREITEKKKYLPKSKQ